MLVTRSALVAALTGIEHLLRRGKMGAPDPHEGSGKVLRRTLGEKGVGHLQILLRRRVAQQRVLQQALLVELADLLGRGRTAPLRGDAGAGQQAFRAAALRERDEQDAGALAPGAAGAAAAVLQDFRIVRQFGVNDEAEIGEVDAARGDVGRDTDARPAVAQRLEGVVAVVLAEFAGERDDRETALQQRRLKMLHGVAGVAEDQRGRCVGVAEEVDHRVLDLVRARCGRRGIRCRHGRFRRP